MKSKPSTTVSITALPNTGKSKITPTPLTEEQASKNRMDSDKRATDLCDRLKLTTCEHKAAELLESLSDDDLDELLFHGEMRFGWALVEGALENHGHIAGTWVINANLDDINFYRNVMFLVEEEQGSRLEEDDDDED